MPYMKAQWKTFITRIKRKLNTPKPVNCVALEQRVKELERKLTKRESNYRQAIRQEITSILIELKK
jgi:ABC-type Zn uptake system ZnuABC Zn-binding protein ZnuA